ncbi:hypothetical protein [Micromonospora sp. NPDC002717]
MGIYPMVLLPLRPLIATALTVLGSRGRAEDLASGTPRRLKL